MVRSVSPGTGPASPLPELAAQTPADKFTASADGKAWFVKAEMVRPLGGRMVHGHVAKRALRLEVTVRHGGRAAAEALLLKLGLEGSVDERRPIPQGRLHGRR